MSAEVEKPILGKLTQGSIFTAAVAEGYTDFPVWGFCITARCDFAHEGKAQVFNYVPIVRFEDWLRVDGGRLLIDKVETDLLNDARNCLKAIDKSPSVLEFHSIADLFQIFFPDESAKSSKNGSRFSLLVEQISKIEILKKKKIIARSDVAVLAGYKRVTSEKLIKDIWSNKLQGYYFLDEIGNTEHSSSLGYVVLLREIHHLPANVAKKIALGVDSESPDGDELNFSVFDFSQAIGKLKSPWVEHLMQNFSLLFSRIGLTDPLVDKYKSLCEVLNHE
jgi:hypothetical protein